LADFHGRELLEQIETHAYSFSFDTCLLRGRNRETVWKAGEESGAIATVKFHSNRELTVLEARLPKFIERFWETRLFSADYANLSEGLLPARLLVKSYLSGAKISAKYARAFELLPSDLFGRPMPRQSEGQALTLAIAAEGVHDDDVKHMLIEPHKHDILSLAGDISYSHLPECRRLLGSPRLLVHMDTSPEQPSAEAYMNSAYEMLLRPAFSMAQAARQPADRAREILVVRSPLIEAHASKFSQFFSTYVQAVQLADNSSSPLTEAAQPAIFSFDPSTRRIGQRIEARPPFRIAGVRAFATVNADQRLFAGAEGFNGDITANPAALRLFNDSLLRMEVEDAALRVAVSKGVKIRAIALSPISLHSRSLLALLGDLEGELRGMASIAATYLA
jgi:hypothetical protein